MNRHFFRLIGVLLAVIVALPAQAQWNDWYVAPSIVYFDDDPDRVVEDAFAGLQITAGRNITERMTLEGLLGYSSIDGYSDSTIRIPDQKHLDISANLLTFYDRERTFAPYVIVGIGYLYPSAVRPVPVSPGTIAAQVATTSPISLPRLACNMTSVAQVSAASANRHRLTSTPMATAYSTCGTSVQTHRVAQR
jgi:hypothetical protein